MMSTLGFNRTFMELKLRTQFVVEVVNAVELNTADGQTVLIVPLWN